MTIRSAFVLAAILAVTAPAFAPRGSAFAQTNPTARQYVVGVSGMH